MSKNNEIHKEFSLSSWAIDNKTVIYVIIFLFLTLGLTAYFNMPRENFPEIKETKIYINAIYPGNTAEDIERLIVDPLEDRLKNVSNVTKMLSTAQQDFGIITLEFDEGVTVEQAKQKVKDEVDQESAKEDWPTFNGAKVKPNVFDISISEETPILNINIAGDYPLQKLKEFAEYLEDNIEDFPEIKKVDIRGAQEREVEVAVDIYKMMAAKVSFQDILGAISGGNITISAGNLKKSGQQRTMRIIGEIKDPKELENFVIKSNNGVVYLKDVATVSFKAEDATTYAREYGKPVVMLDIKKRSGKNMVEAVDKIKVLVADAKENIFPPDLRVTLANDQSEKTLNQVDDLVNNIIFGIILVVTVLMFFLGFRNALFVGFAIPLSMFMSFMILNALGYTMNTMILFGLIMGLGMLVDNGIVVVENVFRLMKEEGMTRIEAAKNGVGEIAFPIIISTLTTVAAFVPLGTWPGVMGQFMIYFPITLSVVLGSSLFVAIFINSMLVSRFMEIGKRELTLKQLIQLTLVLGIIGGLITAFGGQLRGLGTLMLVTALLFWLYKYALKPAANYFQDNSLVWLENQYKRFVAFALKGWWPGIFFIVTFGLLIFAFVGFGASIGSKRTKIEFFPDNKPNQIFVYIEYPEGTDIDKTNKITKSIEQRVYSIIDTDKYIFEDKNVLVESTVSQVGRGAGNPQTDGGSTSDMPHRGKITATMREYKYRRGMDSEQLRAEVQKGLVGIYPGVSISVEKDPVGPPAGPPINIEIKGQDYELLIQTAERMRSFINNKNISGIDELKIDVNKAKPAVKVLIDRKKAGELGVSTGQIGQQLRRSIFGEKAGVYKLDGDNYDINVRFNKDNRYDNSILFNQNLTFRDPNTGRLKEIPLAALATQKNTTSYSAIKHKNATRVVTVYSGLKPGFTDAGAIVSQIEEEMKQFEKPKGVSFDFTGQIEEQNKQQAFLMGAFFAGLGLIFFILIFQFGSISKPAIIMVAIFLSFIGVFGGLVITGAPFVIMMTMMGIISLAGIVVNNGVVLLDYTQLLIDRKAVALGVEKGVLLPAKIVKEAIIEGGRARLRPVLLTAITTVLGLIPLAIGLNINFITLFGEFDAKFYMGGDNVIFWGPLAKTVIYGLIIATFLTLVIVPVLFYLIHLLKLKLKSWFGKETNLDDEKLIAANAEL
ncbi:efflux RND transporter permease subunit [Aquimarina agarivorans]|uniref:efflux RND transporter permease subunit n=1 Tax=Aquimarina agarivorans TaxID=980584 RepID=UPI000248F61D|nr:efflux RND transporter permease subunit [Aquimarina agarivorans]